MISNPGFIDLDDLPSVSRHSSVAPSVYEEAVSPESAKDSLRYQRLLSHHRLELLRLTPQVLDLATGRSSRGVTRQAALAGLQELLGPGVVEALGYPFTPIARALLAFGLIAASQPTQADEWPSRWVRFIVPYGAGGSGDTLARMVAQHMSNALGQQFVIENRAGAGGIIGTQQFIAAAPDGYTIGMTNLSSLTLVPLINPRGSYDPSTDFTHIAYIGGAPVVLSSSIASQVKTLANFVSYAKSPDKAFTFASSGVADGHLMGEAIAIATGVKAVHVPYKATAQALTDMVSGQIPFATFTLSSTAPFIRAKSLNAIAVTTESRLEDFPDVPTFKELGHPELIGTTWFALSGPPKMPKDIAEKLNRAVIEAVNSPEVRSRFRQNGFISRILTSEEFTRYVVDETARWKPVVQKAGLQGEAR